MIILALMAVMSLVSFVLFFADKKYAQSGKWRIPEKTLLLTAALGGALGAKLAMVVFRHKTQKQPFPILVPLFLVLQVAGLGYYFFMM